MSKRSRKTSIVNQENSRGGQRPMVRKRRRVIRGVITSGGGGRRRRRSKGEQVQKRKKRKRRKKNSPNFDGTSRDDIGFTSIPGSYEQQYIVEEEEERVQDERVVKNDDDEIIEIPITMDDSDDEEAINFKIENCLFCKLSDGEKNELSIDSTIILDVENRMRKAIFLGNAIKCAKGCARDINELVIKTYNEGIEHNLSSSSGKKRSRRLTWKCILNHFNHVQKPPFCYKRDLDMLDKMIQNTYRHEMYCTRNDGPYEIDPRNNKRVRKRVTHVNLDAVKLVTQMIDKKVQLNIKVNKEFSNGGGGGRRRGGNSRYSFADKVSKNKKGRK